MRITPGRAAFLIALVAGITFAPRPAASSPQLMAEYGEVSRLLETFEVSPARERLGAIMARNPGNPAAGYFLALINFYDGQYQNAIEAFKSLERSELASIAGEMPLLVSRTAAAIAPLAVHRSEHFILFVDERKDWVLAQPALDALERSYRNIGNLLGVRPADSVRVEIYPQADDFQVASGLTVRDIENSGAIGICRYNKIMLLTPRKMAYGYRWMNTLTHEYIHYLLVKLTGNQAPIWVQEGMASYFENYWKAADPRPVSDEGGALLAKALEEEKLIPFTSMDPGLVKLDTPEQVSLGFAECSTAVDFLMSRGGSEKLLAFLGAIRSRGRDGAWDALRETIGMDQAQFVSGWRQHVGGLGLRKIDNLRVAKHKLAGEEVATEEELFGEIKSQAARQYLSLGDGLRRGGRLKPALVEYKRASRESPESPYLLNKVVIAATLLGDFGTAEEYALKALRIAPDYPLTYLTLGEARLRQERWGEAVARFEEYNEINPFNPEVYRLKGTALERDGKGEAALASWETALRFAPDDHELRQLIDALKRQIL